MKKAVLLFCVCFFLTGCGKKEEPIILEQPTLEPKTIKIVDTNSNTRPIAVVINNSTAAVKVQTGLQQAYMVYEFPVEGGLTRLLALYKDADDLTIGTIRSARHNFLDYVFESDALFVHYGWSHYAKDDIQKLNIKSINGIIDSPFWRDNPENLAREHTAYTSINKIKDYAKSKNYPLTTDKGLVFFYSADDVMDDKENKKQANTVFIPSLPSSSTKYIYDETTKVYKRIVNGKDNIDYSTKKQFTTKNIIVQKINTKFASDHYYWDLETIGKGDGYYITNGFAVPIKWTKNSRTEKTKYTYLDGREVILNDGNTFIQLQSNNQNLTIE